MANIIKLKRGVDSAVDNLTLVDGEIALATDTNRLYSANGAINQKIYYGTTAPDNTLGRNGDLYIIIPPMSTYATPAFRVVNNIIYMQGLINVETESSNSSDEVCKMDAAYAPSTKRYFAAASSTNETNQGSGKALCLTLGTDGIIRVHACAIKGWLSLDGVAILRG